MLWELSDKSKFNVLVVFITVITGLVLTYGVLINTYKGYNYIFTYQGQAHLAVTMLVWMSLSIGIGKKAIQINDDECDGDCDSCGGKSKGQESYLV